MGDCRPTHHSALIRGIAMDKEALQELVGFLNHERGDVSQAALRGLAEAAGSLETQSNLRETDVAAQLVQCLARQDDQIRRNALVCVINLGTDEGLSEALIAAEAVSAVCSVMISQEPQLEKPESAALFDLGTKALINFTRMQSGSESLLSLPEESGMVLKSMKTLALAEEVNESGSSIQRLQLAQVLQNLAAVDMGQHLLLEQDMWVVKEILPVLWDRPQPIIVRMAAFGTLKNLLNAMRRCVPIVLEMHGTAEGSVLVDAVARLVADLRPRAGFTTVQEAEALQQ